MNRITAKQKILERLRNSSHPLAIHEFCIANVSENSIGSRLPELALSGKVIGTTRIGTSYKEWAIAPLQGILPL